MEQLLTAMKSFQAVEPSSEMTELLNRPTLQLAIFLRGITFMPPPFLLLRTEQTVRHLPHCWRPHRLQQASKSQGLLDPQPKARWSWIWFDGRRRSCTGIPKTPLIVAIVIKFLWYGNPPNISYWHSDCGHHGWLLAFKNLLMRKKRSA